MNYFLIIGLVVQSFPYLLLKEEISNGDGLFWPTGVD